MGSSEIIWLAVAGLGSVGAVALVITVVQLPRSASESSNPISKNRVDLFLWAGVLALVVFEVVNRAWLDWLTRHSQFWEFDPATLAAVALAYAGVWRGMRRIQHNGTRQFLRFTWVAIPILSSVALLAVLGTCLLSGGMVSAC